MHNIQYNFKNYSNNDYRIGTIYLLIYKLINIIFCKIIIIILLIIYIYINYYYIKLQFIYFSFLL